MHTDKVLQFIAEKIEDLQVAIFYCHSNSPLRINNTIVQSCKVDQFGCIHFFINRPSQLISQFDREFPVGLNYFKKGRTYFMNIFGKARIIHDPEELAYQPDLTAEEINSALTTHIFIKVQILKVDFYDKNYERKNLLFKKVSSVFSSLFDRLGVASRSFDFSHAQAHHYGLSHL